MSVSIGLMGSVSPEVIREIAPAVEAAGFRSLWLNEGAGADSLAGLAVAAEVTSTLQLACGVIPLDSRPAPAILQHLRQLGLPADRLVVGIGSGGPAKALSRVKDALAELRAGTSATLVVGALGPRMRRLAAERSDGFVLNWLDPGSAAAATARLRLEAAGQPRRSVLYVRTALEDAASPFLVTEAARYAASPSYAANFARLGIDPLDAAIDGAGALVTRVREYEAAVDEVVLRAITVDHSARSIRAFVEQAATAL